MPIHSHIAFGCFHNTTAEKSGCYRDHVACKAENIYYPALYLKSLPTSVIDLDLPALTKQKRRF